MNLGIMTKKGHSILLKAPELDPLQQMQFSVIPRTPHFGEEESYSTLEDTVSVF